MRGQVNLKIETDSAPPVKFKPPLKPQKRLLIALSVLFAAWVVFLLILYFKTTYPIRHT